MNPLILLSALVIFSPYTKGHTQWYCFKGECPEIRCPKDSWVSKNFDQSGREFVQCRYYTKNGKELQKANDKLIEQVNRCI